MLESLPWPRHLKNVPEYAGGHHERMDGKGYPRGLTRDQMSVQARVMGIADIFEALTAKDRPYKKGKTLTESLQHPRQVQAQRTHRSGPVRHLRPRPRVSALCRAVPRSRTDRRRRRNQHSGLLRRLTENVRNCPLRRGPDPPCPVRRVDHGLRNLPAIVGIPRVVAVNCPSHAVSAIATRAFRPRISLCTKRLHAL